jgi:branched-chain amino acid transport system ATP-binding protein
LLEISNVSKNFGGLLALSEIDLIIRPGELVSIIGPNGSGKSTLFNVVTGIYRSSSGAIRFNGKDITHMKPYQVTRQGIGRTFQQTAIFSRASVLDNVIIGQRLHTRTAVWGAIFNTRSTRREEAQTREKARQILSFVDLEDKDSQIAATEPKLLLLDEPTGGVNIREIDGLIELVEKVRKSGISICLIEHKMRMVMSISDRVIALCYGKKIAEGTPKEVASHEQVVKAYLGECYAAPGK